MQAVFLLASLAAGTCVCIGWYASLLHSCVFHISHNKYMLAQREEEEVYSKKSRKPCDSVYQMYSPCVRYDWSVLFHRARWGGWVVFKVDNSEFSFVGNCADFFWKM